jgi:hypothetical protein
LSRRRARIERIAAEAETLFCGLGVAAYSEARRREHEASSDAIAEDWALVALTARRRHVMALVKRCREAVEVRRGSPFGVFSTPLRRPHKVATHM